MTGYYSTLSLGCTGKACSAETAMFVARGPRIVFTRMRAPLSLPLVFRLVCGHLRGGGRALPRIGRRQGGPQAARRPPAQDRACCTHTAGYPRFPDLRPIGAPIPVSRPNRETGDFPIPVPGRSGIGNSLPVSRPNRESGERELGISGSGPRGRRLSAAPGKAVVIS